MLKNFPSGHRFVRGSMGGPEDWERTTVDSRKKINKVVVNQVEILKKTLIF